MTDKTPAPRFLGSSYASGTKQGQTAEVSSDGGEPVTSSRRECLATATGAGFGSLPYIFDHGNSPDLTQWLAHVKAFGWPFRAFDDPRKKVAALYVQTGGAYFDLPSVDPWDEARDARKYDGPWPVVAHPPCQRWGKMWAGSPLVIARDGIRKVKGDDGGCFAAALEAVRKWGGVIEHPWESAAWPHFGLNVPPREGGWVNADFNGGWTCCVEQGAYGHYARKPTLLLVYGVDLADLETLVWGKTAARIPQWAIDRYGEKRAKRIGELSFKGGGTDSTARIGTPPAFRELLIAIAKSATPALFDDPRNVKDGE